MADGENHSLTGDTLVKALAVGRLGTALADDKDPPKHTLVAFYVNPTAQESAKDYKNHLKAIMTRGASRFTAGKRIKLTSEAHDYDVHIIAEYAYSGSDEYASTHRDAPDADDEDNATEKDGIPLKKNNPLILFFALTHPDIGKFHPVSTIMKDIKTSAFSSCSGNDLANSKSKSLVEQKLSKTYPKLLEKYSTSVLNTVTDKVENVRSIMQDNVKKAMGNVEQLEQIEEKATAFENQARLFNKNSNKLKNLFRCRYYKIMCFIGLLVAAIVGYIIYAIYEKVHG